MSIVSGITDSDSDKFRFSGKKYHLTYPTWICLEGCLARIEELFGELEWHSLVHEEGHSKEGEEPEGVEAYNHTHVAFSAKKKINKRGARILDLEGQHPHIQSIASETHAVNIWGYHLKAPKELMRSKCGPGPKNSADSWKQVKAARTLQEACELAGIGPKTVADIVLIRKDNPAQRDVAPLTGACCWTLVAPTSFRALFLYGGTGLGKTRWAIAQFKSPLLVSHLEDLKAFRPDLHDGLVFDDMCLAGLEPAVVGIHLVDWECPRTLNVKFGSITIPAETQKIFTSNKRLEDTFPRSLSPEQWDAVRRRFTKVIHLESATFDRAKPQPVELSEELMQPTSPLEEVDLRARTNYPVTQRTKRKWGDANMQALDDSVADADASLVLDGQQGESDMDWMFEEDFSTEDW